jgi:hypothetical protein
MNARVRSTRHVSMKSSGGTNWGGGGYCTVHYAYLENRDLSDDFRTIRRGENI